MGDPRKTFNIASKGSSGGIFVINSASLSCNMRPRSSMRDFSVAHCASAMFESNGACKEHNSMEDTHACMVMAALLARSAGKLHMLMG